MSTTKDYSSTLRAVKQLRDKNSLQCLCDSATNLMLYIGDPDGYKDDVKTLALSCATLFGFFTDLDFLYGELGHEEKENSDDDHK